MELSNKSAQPVSMRSTSSTSSLQQSQSVRSNRPPPPPKNIVITSPPWARDEPPSPTDLAPPTYPSDSRRSDVGSLQSSFAGPSDSSRWWAFTLPRPRDRLPHLNEVGGSSPSKADRRQTMKDRSMSWLSSVNNRSTEGTLYGNKREKYPEANAPSTSARDRTHDWNLQIAIPTPVPPFTLSQTKTPGWDSPWAPRVRGQGDSPLAASENILASNEESEINLTTRRRRVRACILTNTYIPLLFRFINIMFTTAALAVAIRIRSTEGKYGVKGIVGSSPTLVIIFTPLTLIHVMAAIYLEYFGRPLGLWRTSHKLTHTLSEVLFICAWSSALSLCFDNFFTSLVPCASLRTTLWYNALPRPVSPILHLQSTVGDRLCDDQLALIILVGVGLIMYCMNLVISLFRIFEKVKYHPGALSRSG